MKMRVKGVLVKKVPTDYEMTNEEAELIARLIEKGYVVILDRGEKIKGR